MTSGRSLFLLLALTLFVSTALAHEKHTEAAALIENAKQLSDIRAEGAPAFRLKVSLKIIQDDGSALEGAYTEDWVSKEQWRRETVLGDFRRTQIATGRKLWLLDNARTVPGHVGDVLYLTPFSLPGFQAEKWKSSKVSELKRVSVRCVEKDPDSLDSKSTLCFDKISGTLRAEVSPLYPRTRGQKVCFYNDYQKFGDRVLARSYQCDEDKHPRIDVKIVELVPEPTTDPEFFAPPKGAKESVNCLGSMRPPTLVYSPDPVFPLARTSAISSQGLITMLGIVVGTDGKTRDLRVTSAPVVGFDEAALKAVRLWRFKPATCDGEPVETEMAVEVNFRLR